MENHPPTLIFLIGRTTYYRLFGALIDEALGRGLAVECWHDHTRPKGGEKAYAYPDVESAPPFRNGVPMIRSYKEKGDLSRLLEQRGRVTVFSLFGPARYESLRKPAPVNWVCLQHGIDVFISQTLEELLSADSILLMSQHWIGYALDYYRSQGPVSDVQERQYREKAKVVGFPEADTLAQLDPASTRSLLGLPADAKILLYLPWDKAVFFFPWCQVFAFPDRPWRAILRMLMNPSFIRYFLAGWHEYRVFKALQAYCKRAGYFLAVKSRQKSRDGRYIKEGCGAFFLDRLDYPATILELIRVSDACVHYHSLSSQELGAAGVPTISIHMDPFTRKEDGYGPYIPLLKGENGNFFDWKGFSTVLTPVEFARQVESGELSKTLSVDREKVEAYRAKFLGSVDGISSARALDALGLVSSPARASQPIAV